MLHRERVTVEPGKRDAKPCLRGLRITVAEVLAYLAAGMSEAELLEDFPSLCSEDVRTCLAFAAEEDARRGFLPDA